MVVFLLRGHSTAWGELRRKLGPPQIARGEKASIGLRLTPMSVGVPEAVPTVPSPKMALVIYISNIHRNDVGHHVGLYTAASYSEGIYCAQTSLAGRRRLQSLTGKKTTQPRRTLQPLRKAFLLFHVRSLITGYVSKGQVAARTQRCRGLTRADRFPEHRLSVLLLGTESRITAT